MKGTLATIKELAACVRLELSHKEEKYLLGQLNLMLDIMVKLRQLDVATTGSALHLSIGPDVLRDDRVGPSLACEEILESVLLLPEKNKNNLP
ncbi:MAG: Asp-tRNA(Asn)/Glu-tRNA(Gln) amidotransferase GatCAB subunit C [Firmicutes bacterium]|nr:Asp-tRNA(Asn)/Glu-tRNA(Gln) amidotransferase GatCAB subunit C [Bacillota bacterium]